jgi:hypothetical protein
MSTALILKAASQFQNQSADGYWLKISYRPATRFLFFKSFPDEQRFHTRCFSVIVVALHWGK